MNDIGHISIKDVTYQVVDVQKVGKCVLHFLDKPLPVDLVEDSSIEVKGEVDKARRDQLR